MSPSRAVDASMSLIKELTVGSLEPSYREAARRRQEAGQAPASANTVLATVVAMLIGVLFAMAALNVQATTTVVERARSALIEQIQTRQELGDRHVQQLQALQVEIAEARAAALGQAGRGELAARVSALELAAGTTAVLGPGLVVTLDDAASPPGNAEQPRGGAGFGTNRVTSTDLQIIVNGLWAAGAEAIAINDQRVTARTAIRFAGEAILVDYRALTRPYRISAIGDPSAMVTAFGGSPTGGYLKALSDNYGIPVSIVEDRALTCPPGASAPLRHAQPQPNGIPSASGSSTNSPQSTPRPTTRPNTSSTTTTKASR